jgi:hypothetical protein
LAPWREINPNPEKKISRKGAKTAKEKRNYKTFFNLAPLREISQRADGGTAGLMVADPLGGVYVDAGVVVEDDLSLLPEGFSLFLASVFFASPFDSEVDGGFASLPLFASPFVCPLRA